MTLPPWMSSSAGLRRQNRRSASQEARHAKAVQGRVQAGSGSSHRARGDVRSAEHLDELKMTAARSFSLSASVITKIISAAEQYGREPRMIVDYTTLGIRAVITFEDL